MIDFVAQVNKTKRSSLGALLLKITVLTGTLAILSNGAVTTISYVQSNYVTPQTPQSMVNVTFTASQHAADLNVVVVGWNDSTAVVEAVTDTKGNTYIRAVGPTVQSGTASQSIYYAKNIAAAAAGANTVTVTFATAAISADIRVLEYAGADPSNPVDVTAASSGNSATSSSGTATTTNATDLILGANLVQTSVSGPGSGFTGRLLTTPDGDIVEDQMASATGSYSATAPLSSAGPWIMQIVALRTASSGGAVAPTVTSVSPNNGSTAGGTAVTITGTKFVAGAVVAFGGKAATNVVVVSETQISAMTPAGSAGVVTVAVTNTGGPSGNLANGFSYVSAPATPTALTCGPSTLGPNATSTCTVSLNNAAPAGGSSVTLASNNSALGVPTSVTVAAGASSGTFTAKTGTLISANQSATITAKLNGVSQSATVNLIVAATISYVQGNSATPQTAQSMVSVPFTAAQSAGDLNVVVVGWNDSTAVVSAVTDTKGNPYTRAVGPTVQSGTASQSIYYAKNITAAGAGANTVMVTFATAAVSADIRILEYAGADPSNPVDVTAASSGNSVTSSSGAAATTNATDLLFSANLVQTTTTGPGSGFTERLLTTPDGDIAEDQMATATGSYSATAPLSSAGPWIMQMVAFRAASSGGTVAPTVTSVSPNSGSTAGGTAVTITGTKFAAGAAVTFGGKTATNVVVVSGTQISATTPAGSAGAVTVTVTNSGALSGNLANGFSYASVSTTPTALTCSPTSLGQNASSTCTVTLNQAAASGGSAVVLSRSNATLTVPASVTVAAGSSSATFAATTGVFSTSQSSTITATLNSVSQTASISLVAGATSYLLPLKASSNDRYLVDQNGTPFMLVGDSPQALIGNLTSSDMALYMADRQRLGFNALWVNLLCDNYTFCNSNGTTYDGVAPFTSGASPSTYDLSTPNSAYFSRVDSMVNMALANNLIVFLDPIETGGWLTTLEKNGSAKAYNYGVYIGNRYKNATNIAWLQGNDFQSWSTNSADNNLVKQVMAGIASVDSNHLQTIELSYNSSYSNQDSALGSLLTLDSAYTYYETYDMVLQSYASTPTIPTYLVESNYEYENNTGGLPGPAGPFVLREQAYWTVLSGGTGEIYGNHYTTSFIDGWQSYLDSPGALEIRYFNQLFGGVAWWKLAPDATHKVVTAGYGAYNGSNTNLTVSNYCTTGWASDGSLAITYCPNPTTLTVNLAQFGGPVTAEWYDPSSGTCALIAGSPFSNIGTHAFGTPGKNHDGDLDWVLILGTQ